MDTHLHLHYVIILATLLVGENPSKVNRSHYITMEGSAPDLRTALTLLNTADKNRRKVLLKPWIAQEDGEHRVLKHAMETFLVDVMNIANTQMLDYYQLKQIIFEVWVSVWYRGS